MMVGHPSETLDDVRSSIRLLAELESEHPLVGTETPFPGAALYRLARRSGWLRTPDWSEYVTHAALPVSRNRHFDPAELYRLTCLVRRAGELFGALARARRRRAWRLRSRATSAWVIARAVADRFGAPHQDELSLDARVRLAAGFLARAADPGQLEATLRGLGPGDLARLPLPSARTLDELAAAFAPGTRVLVVPNTSAGAVLPVLRSLCASARVAEVGVAGSAALRESCALPDVAHPKLRPLPRAAGSVARAIRAGAPGWDAVLVPSLSFSPAAYARLLLRLLVARPAPVAVYVVALGTGGNVIRACWRELARELLVRAAARLDARIVAPLRVALRAWRLAAVAARDPSPPGGGAPDPGGAARV
jgi:hypothetical protein